MKIGMRRRGEGGGGKGGDCTENNRSRLLMFAHTNQGVLTNLCINKIYNTIPSRLPFPIKMRFLLGYGQAIDIYIYIYMPANYRRVVSVRGNTFSAVETCGKLCLIAKPS